MCDRLHVGTTAPRRLCTARHYSAPDGGHTALLDVHVSACPSHPDEPMAPAMITLAGELSSITVDEVVRGSLLAYVRFARHTVLDLTRLAMIDDRGARLFDELAESVADLGGTIAVHDPGVLVEHVIRFCGVSDRILICSPR